MIKKLIILLLLLLMPYLYPREYSVQAQEPEPTENQPSQELPLIDWQELKTEHFIIVYAAGLHSEQSLPLECDFCGVAEAERYATFIDGMVQELTAIFWNLKASFEIPIDAPINLRLFPTEESYTIVNPLAKFIPGATAHASSERNEIAVAVSRTAELNEIQFINNIRHELTHLLVSHLSNNKLNIGFQEGIAQYLEKPAQDSGNAPALLQLAVEQNRLMSWDELNDSQAVYANSQIAYPESLSIVSFLIDSYSLPTFIEFIKATAQEPGYRSALETTYILSAEQLETEWRAYLPDYFAGRWQINAVYNYDLSRLTALVKQGAYSDAEIELAKVVDLLKTTHQLDTLAQANSLLTQAQQGKQATMLAHNVHAALQKGDYDLAMEQGHTAAEIYNALDQPERVQEVQTFIYRAEIGQHALQQLRHGENLLAMFRFFEAERIITDATLQLQALDNQAEAARGIALLHQSAEQQSYLAYFLLIAGILLLLANGAHRLINYWSANPLEVQFR